MIGRPPSGGVRSGRAHGLIRGSMRGDSGRVPPVQRPAIAPLLPPGSCSALQTPQRRAYIAALEDEGEAVVTARLIAALEVFIRDQSCLPLFVSLWYGVEAGSRLSGVVRSDDDHTRRQLDLVPACERRTPVGQC